MRTAKEFSAPAGTKEVARAVVKVDGGTHDMVLVEKGKGVYSLFISSKGWVKNRMGLRDALKLWATNMRKYQGKLADRMKLSKKLASLSRKAGMVRSAAFYDRMASELPQKPKTEEEASEIPAPSKDDVEGKGKGDGPEYEKYFEKKLKEKGVSSPSEIPEGEKAKFFEDVDKGWKSDEEEAQASGAALAAQHITRLKKKARRSA